MKVSIDSVVKALKEVNLAAADTRKVIEKLNHEAEVNKKDPHAGPKSKKQFVILTNADKTAGWVVQIEEGGSPAKLVDRVKRAAIEYNNSRKGRLTPVATVGETLQVVGRRFFKDSANPDEVVLVKTKEPVILVVTDNKLS